MMVYLRWERWLMMMVLDVECLMQNEKKEEKIVQTTTTRFNIITQWKKYVGFILGKFIFFFREKI